MVPRITRQWNQQVARVLAYIGRNPGSTAAKIAFHTGVSVRRVHQIVAYDVRVNRLAVAGFVAVNEASIKPRWYHPWMANVPVVRGSGIAVIDQSEAQSLRECISDPGVQATVIQLIHSAKQAMIDPSRSVCKRKTDALAVLSGIETICAGLQERTNQVKLVRRELHRMETLLIGRE